jgi:hypothetical protein
MLKIKIEKDINPHTLGEAFAKADSHDQTLFLISFVQAISFGKWAMQCSYIADEENWDKLICGVHKKDVISHLEVLIEHLKETPDEK